MAHQFSVQMATVLHLLMSVTPIVSVDSQNLSVAVVETVELEMSIQVCLFVRTYNQPSSFIVFHCSVLHTLLTYVPIFLVSSIPSIVPWH